MRPNDATNPSPLGLYVGLPFVLLLIVFGALIPNASSASCLPGCAKPAKLPGISPAPGAPPRGPSTGRFASGSGPAGAPGSSPASGNVEFGPILGEPNPTLFWAVEGHMPSGAPDARLAALMNGTPVSVYRFAAGVDSTNQTAGITYSDSGVPGPAVLDAPQLATWCTWTHCRADWNLPAETGNVGAAAATVRYVEDTLHFRPAYWSIGNEPWGWTHYGIPWTSWRTTDRSGCSAVCYAGLVQRMVPALRSVDPSIRVIGIQNSDCFNSSYLQEIAARDAPLVAAVACHAYPLAGNPHPSLSEYFASLTGPDGLTAVIPRARAAVSFGCRCSIPVFVDEYNAFVISGPNPLMASYAEVPWMAASVVQALELNLSQLEYYALQDTGSASAYDMVDPGDTPAPVYYLYHTVLSNLFLGEVESLRVRTVATGVFSVETVIAAGNHHSVFVVNTNLTRGVPVDLSGSSFPLGGSGMSWVWTPGEPQPQVRIYAPGALPAQWSVPPEGVLLVNSA
jgi:hypothetical protein